MYWAKREGKVEGGRGRGGAWKGKDGMDGRTHTRMHAQTDAREVGRSAGRTDRGVEGRMRIPLSLGPPIWGGQSRRALQFSGAFTLLPETQSCREIINSHLHS